MPLRRYVLAVALIAAAAVTMLAAQDTTAAPDTAKRRPPPGLLYNRPLPIEAPTVVAFGTTRPAPFDSTVAALRAVAERWGFDFVTVPGLHVAVADVRYHAVYFVPEGVTSGFVLIVPGCRTDLVRGRITPDSLALRLRNYLRAVRP